MKKLLMTMLFMGISTISYAQYTGTLEDLSSQDFFVSPYEVSRVADVRKMPDDIYVTIVGNIVAQKGHDREKYLFKDESGEIIVEIDKKIWRNQPVSPETKVKILGELDQSRRADRVKVEVVYLEVIQ